MAVGLGRYKFHSNHTSNSDFDRTVVPCLGYYLIPAEPEWGGAKNVDCFFEILVETISLEIDKCMSKNAASVSTRGISFIKLEL